MCSVPCSVGRGGRRGWEVWLFNEDWAGGKGKGKTEEFSSSQPGIQNSTH